MEFLDEYESRPRFVLQSKQLPSDPNSNSSSPPFQKPTLILSLSLSILIFTLTFLYVNVEPIKSLLFWFSLSLLIGPFAPLSITAGDIRVGLGPPIKDIPVGPEPTDNQTSRKSNKKPPPSQNAAQFDTVPVNIAEKRKNERVSSSVKEKNERSWNEGDEELLRKLMGKHPVGKPGRWEAISEGFNGEYSVESVIKKAKEIGERKVSDEDSYTKFLKDRKTVDKRVVDVVEQEKKNECEWSSGEDLALLNALKLFPKDVTMRWERIAAAVPGKSKAACVKRVSELKRDFRSSKASSNEVA